MTTYAQSHRGGANRGGLKEMWRLIGVSGNFVAQGIPIIIIPATRCRRP